MKNELNGPTVSLTMIVKDEAEQVNKIVYEALKYFTKIILVVSDKKTYELLKKVSTGTPVEVYYREWNNRFDEARNFALEKVTTDYWFWLDADDVFEFSSIPKLVAMMEERDYDQISLPYNYAQDEDGHCVAYHWRERLIRSSHPFKWKGWVHEALVSDTPYKAHNVKGVNAEVTHKVPQEHIQESLARNHKILEEAVKNSDDPRYKLYLGSSYHAFKEYEKAINILDLYLRQSGSSEDSYKALCLISECYFLLGELDLAVDFALKATGLIPSFPQAYWLLGQWESERKAYEEAVEWIKVSETKDISMTKLVIDPQSRFRARLIAAQAEFMLGNYKNSYEWLKKIPRDNKFRQEIQEDVKAEAELETFIELLPNMEKFFANSSELFWALSDDIKYDPRLRVLRNKATEPNIWPKRSVAILCGQGFEEWGPHTLHKGMGGSEEAVVYLSRELVKLGFSVTVYAEADMVADGVRWKPWQQFDRRDKFDVFVAWRSPQFTRGINARLKLVDMHDVLPKEQVIDYPDVKYMFKSKYQRELYPHIPDEKAIVIGNGINKGDFK